MEDHESSLARLWDKLNPSEPSPAYLAKLMAFMMVTFAIGLLIGHYT